MTKIEIKELKPIKMSEFKRKKCESLVKNLNDLPIHKDLDVLILGSVSFGVCEEGEDDIRKTYDGPKPINIKRVDENRYLIKKEDGSLIDDLNLKSEWNFAIIKKFGKDFPGIACELIEPSNSFSYIYF